MNHMFDQKRLSYVKVPTRESSLHVTVIEEINGYKISEPGLNDDRREGYEKFWKQIRKDMQLYNDQMAKAAPLDKTCYKPCHGCLKKFDRSFWNYSLTGYSKHVVITPYKYPGKVSVVFLVMLSGIFKMIRANNDGKASFYGTLLNIAAQFLGGFLLVKDGDFVMTIPKLAGFCVGSIILYGIITNSVGPIGL